MGRFIRFGLVLTTWVALASAPALATGRGWSRGGDSDRPSWQNDDSDHHSSWSKKKTKKIKGHDGGPAVPEPTGAVVFAAGMLAVRRATRRR